MKYLVLVETNSSAYNNFRHYNNIKDAIKQYKYYKDIIKMQIRTKYSSSIVRIVLLDVTNATELEVKE